LAAEGEISVTSSAQRSTDPFGESLIDDCGETAHSPEAMSVATMVWLLVVSTAQADAEPSLVVPDGELAWEAQRFTRPVGEVMTTEDAKGVGC